MNSKTLVEQALALHRSGKLADAEALYVRAAQADAGDAAVRNSLGVVLAQQGRGAEALNALDAALALRPDDGEIILNRANVLQMLGRPAEALPGFDHALNARPDSPQLLNNRGSALADLGRTAEALESYDRAVALAPTFTPARNNRGGLLLAQQRFAEALADFDSALQAKPDDPVLLNNRGNALQGLLRYDDAVTAYTDAIARAPKIAETFNNRATALQQMKRHGAALADFETALALDPAQPHAFGGAAMAALNLCDWERVARFTDEMPARIGEVPPWVLLGYSGDEALQLACARAAIGKRFANLPPPLATGGYKHDRIRLAYVSSDFRHHPVAAQIARVIERHDRRRFEVIGISTGPDDGSPQRRRLMAAFDSFHDMRGRGPAQIAYALRAMEVDVLVDLNGHTDGDNFNILAHRPAPVQATWLGYAGTTAAPFIDWLVADAVVAPDAAAFSEKLLRLPGCFFPVDDSLAPGIAPMRADQGLPPDGFVFCCFNNNWKFTAPVFAIWMRLLQAVPGSVLWLKQAGEALPNLRRAAQDAGIDPDRLVFAKGAALDVHLARHALADLFLDTLPYNAHATACDALAAGLPVLTCRGTAFAGRVAASMLTASGVPELIAETPEEYEAMALALARDPAWLKALRQKLAANRALFDTARFTRDLETAIEDICRPPGAGALVAQGLTALDHGHGEAALALFDRAIAADPMRAAAHQGRGRVLALEKRNAEALQSFERALALDPSSPEAFDGVALTALHLCDWPRVAQIGLELASRIAAGQEVSPWTLLGYSGDAALQRRAAQRDIAARIPPFAPLWRGERHGHGRIRLAYISSDLRRHVVGGQIVELIARHDRSRFEVLGIATTPDDGSALRAQLVGAFDQFHDVSGQNPLEIARLLRALEVDVLVDLNGHTQSENFAVLAQRPAPVQASWLGYAGTTGTDFLHQIVDDVVAPDVAEFSEKLLRLPHSFFVSDTSRVLGACPSRAQQGLPEDRLVFCSFNNNWKITAPVFALWMRLLDAVPGSVLWLRQSGGGADANLRRAAKAHGVAPERLVFAAREEDIGVHLARHALADLFLDTLPYNAHATACDALYAGLPVLTCRGTAFAGRVAASLLTAIEMPELIAESPEDYEALALALAREPARLGELRAKLAANRATAPLFDTTRFARDLEAALISLL